MEILNISFRHEEIMIIFSVLIENLTPFGIMWCFRDCWNFP